MKLPTPTAGYSPIDQAQMRSVIERADALSLKRNQDIEVSRNRLILSDAAGVRWEVYVGTDGSLNTRTV